MDLRSRDYQNFLNGYITTFSIHGAPLRAREFRYNFTVCGEHERSSSFSNV